jgi:hypothetical protein
VDRLWDYLVRRNEVSGKPRGGKLASVETRIG